MDNRICGSGLTILDGGYPVFVASEMSGMENDSSRQHRAILLSEYHDDRNPDRPCYFRSE
jgi:hypothetical protein